MIDHLAKIAPLLAPSFSKTLGRHLTARVGIKKGTIVCREEVPVFVNPSGIGLTEVLVSEVKIRESFPFLDNLHANPNKAKRGLFDLTADQLLLVERIETNGFDTGSGSQTLGLSLFVAMAAHGCDPSTSYAVGTWPSRDDVNEVRAVSLRDLAPGENVTIRYGPCLTMPQRYGFTAKCSGKCCKVEPLSEFGHDLKNHRPSGTMIPIGMPFQEGISDFEKKGTSV